MGNAAGSDADDYTDDDADNYADDHTNDYADDDSYNDAADDHTDNGAAAERRELGEYGHCFYHDRAATVWF